VFRISRRTDYAVRVMVTLAGYPPGERVSTPRIQAATQVPGAFLQRIVATLRRAGLVHAHPGTAGGLHLARPAEAITLLDVHSAVEGPIHVSDCVDDPRTCARSGPCTVRPQWERLQEVLVNELRATTLADLVRAHPEAARRPAPRRKVSP
jgi:Rrf2 family protein